MDEEQANMAESRKTSILLYGDNLLVLKALAQTMHETPSLAGYEICGLVKYDPSAPRPAVIMTSVDFRLYGLYRRYDMRTRAEGVAILRRVLPLGRKAMVFGFGIDEVADNPLVWDGFGTVSLADKITGWALMGDPLHSLCQLEKHFSDLLFDVGGH